MTPLERAVVETMARLNHPLGPEDPPYPASLLPIAQGVIEVVQAFEEWRHSETQPELGGLDLTDEEFDSFMAAIGKGGHA